MYSKNYSYFSSKGVVFYLLNYLILRQQKLFRQIFSKVLFPFLKIVICSLNILNPPLYIWIYTFIYTYISTYVHIYTFIDVYMYVNIFTHYTYTYHTYIYIYIYIYIYLYYIYTYLYYIYTYIIYIYIHIYTYIIHHVNLFYKKNFLKWS